MQTTRPAWVETTVYLVAWLIGSLLCIVDALFIRNAVLSFMVWSEARAANTTSIQISSAIETADKVVLLVVMCAAIAFVIWIENAFRKGMKVGKLYKRIAIVGGIEVAVAAVALLVQLVFGGFHG